MAELTSSQNLSGNPRTGKDRTWTLLQKVILNVLKRFRFLEIGEVTNIDVTNYMVRCKLLYRKDTSTGEQRITKWLKVYSPFASDDEGFVAMPNRGDYGIIFFRNGDQAGGTFYGMHFGQKRTIPTKNKSTVTESLHQRDLMLKRNGSWVLIDGVEGDEVNRRYADIELWHKDENYARITKGFEILHVEDENQIDIQRWSNHHTQGTEYKVCAWIRSKTVIKDNKEVYGDIQNIKMRRRKITVTPPVVCCGAAYVESVEESNDDQTLDPIVTKQHITDKTRKVTDSVIDKTLIKGSPGGQQFIFNMSRHQTNRDVKAGTDLTGMPVAGFGTQMTISANMNFAQMAHSIITTVVDSGQSFMLFECWFNKNYSYLLLGANESYPYMDSDTRIDEDFLALKTRYKTFAYEIGEFNLLINTDHLVDDDIDQRAIDGLSAVGTLDGDAMASAYMPDFIDRFAMEQDFVMQAGMMYNGDNDWADNLGSGEMYVPDIVAAVSDALANGVDAGDVSAPGLGFAGAYQGDSAAP